MDQLLARILRYIRSHGLLHDGDRVLVALSGGPDSIALALILAQLSAEKRLPLDLALAHLNHCLRGEESDAEEEFCRRFARDNGLQLDVERLDVVAAVERAGGSVEAVARELRYDFLLRAAERAGARAVATGHHADDVAETVLLRLIRGAGVAGLGALPPARPLGKGVRLVRPLLDVRRAELRAHLAARDQPFCEDRSNRDTGYARNRVRHRLIPALERDYATFSTASLCALNESAVETARFLRRAADELWQQTHVGTNRDQIELDAAKLRAAGRALRKAVCARAVEWLGGDEAARALRAEHYGAMAGLPDCDTGKVVSLPGGLIARKEHGLIHFARRAEGASFPERPLPVPGRVDVPEAGLRVEGQELPPGGVGLGEVKAMATEMEVYVSRDAVGGHLTVRRRRPGDRFHPLGAPGEARLKKFFINARIPRHERDRIPLVTDGEGRIVWVVGHRIGDPFKLTGDGQRALRLLAVPLDAGRP